MRTQRDRGNLPGAGARAGIAIPEVREVLKHNIESVFQVKLALTELAALEAMLREEKVNLSPSKSAGFGLRSP